MIEINEKTMAASPTHKVTRNTKKTMSRTSFFVHETSFMARNIHHQQTNNQPRVFSKQRWPMPSLGMFNFQQLDLEMNMSNLYQQKIQNSLNWPSQVNELIFNIPKISKHHPAKHPRLLAKWHRSPRGTATAQWWRSQGSKEPHQPAPGGQGHWGW